MKVCNMQKGTLPVSRHHAYDGVVIKRIEKELCKTIKDRDTESKKKAICVIKDATKKAESLRIDAVCDGYQIGIQTAFEHIIDYICEWKLKQNENRRNIEDYITSLLSENLHDERIISTLLEQWLSSLRNTVTELKVVLPKCNLALRKKLELDLHKYRSDVKIILKYSEGNNYIFCSGNQVVEFSPQDVISGVKIELAEKLTKND
ncbi:Mxi-Spa type III secretion system linker protein MxiN, partial [Shigella sonnei]